jgi:hypothetical protein
MNLTRGLRITIALQFFLLIWLVATSFLAHRVDHDLFHMIHGWPGYLFGALIVVHLVLNRDWLLSTFAGRHGPAVPQTEVGATPRRAPAREPFPRWRRREP